jgi:hypothetical protein
MKKQKSACAKHVGGAAALIKFSASHSLAAVTSQLPSKNHPPAIHLLQ